MNSIRVAKLCDCEFILQMIKDLAEYEKASHEVIISAKQLEIDGFEENLFDAIILEQKGSPVGMALFYNRYSTWKGKSLYLEDLYIIPQARGNGLGLMAMKYLAKLANDTKCNRFEWQVLDWNTPSIKFYESFKTQLDGEWINCRLEGDEVNFLLDL